MDSIADEWRPRSRRQSRMGIVAYNGFVNDIVRQIRKTNPQKADRIWRHFRSARETLKSLGHEAQ